MLFKKLFLILSFFCFSKESFAMQAEFSPESLLVELNEIFLFFQNPKVQGSSELIRKKEDRATEILKELEDRQYLLPDHIVSLALEFEGFVTEFKQDFD